MRTVRGLTIVALSTVLALALIGVLGIQVGHAASSGDHTPLANDRQLPTVGKRAGGVVCTQHLAELSDVRRRR